MGAEGLSEDQAPSQVLIDIVSLTLSTTTLSMWWYPHFTSKEMELPSQ